jgi:integrase
MVPPRRIQNRTIRALAGRTIRQIAFGAATAGQHRGHPWNSEGFVFSRSDGAPMSPDAVTHDFTKRTRAVGIEGIHLHSLRHGFAFLLLAQGEHPKVVQDLLGHSNVAITMDTYSHVMPGLKDAAVDEFAARFSGSYNHS